MARPIKAPEWFVEAMQKSHDLLNEAKADGGDPERFSMLPTHTKDKIIRKIKYAEILAAYAWRRWEFETDKTEPMSYHVPTKTIKKDNVIKKIGEIIGKTLAGE